MLQETPLASRPNSSGVSRATVKSMIDVTVRGCSELLLTDHLSAGLLPNLPKMQLTEPGQCSVGKRTNNKSLQSPPAKKAKVLPEAELSKLENAHPSSSPEFSFEVSEDEEEQKVNQAHRDPQNPDVYFCKHCDFREGDFNLMFLHYQNDHPYVRCNVAYINNSNDQSATFRCLECPFEFASAVDLKWHYTEKHPAAPDVFKLKSSELCLLFKCFQCDFACDALKPLRQHYKESHPACSVDNSLLFCRYSVPKSSQDDESCKLQKHETSARPEQLIERSPERERTLRTEVQETPSPQRPTPTRLDMHTCQICSFAHKSVVVMHVHYRKHHPEEANSIARLRQLASSPSHLPQQTPQKELSKKEDPELSKQKRVLSVQVEEAEALTFMDRISKEPLGSHQGEAQPQTDAESTEGSPGKIKMKEVDAKDLSTTKADAYGDPENLFYCETCNYGNPSIKGIQNHQIKIHRHTINNECVAEYTSMMCDQIKKSKAADKGSISAHHLPLPVLNSGDENMFFCPICNYRHDTIQKVMRHHSARHGGFYMKSTHIDQYTSVVLKQTKKPTPEIEIKKKEEDKKKLHSYSSDSPSAKVPQTERVLQCYRCDFHTPVVYVLKKHLLKMHNVNRAYKDIIRLCYRAGSLESGYHCEWCVFSDKTTVAVFEHYREQHPQKQINYPYINTKLYAGPKILQTHKKKNKFVETTNYSTSEQKRSDHQRNEKPSSSNQVEDLSKIPGLFESFQVPLDDTDDQTLSTSEKFKCPSCPQSFRSQSNLSAHCGTEHKDVVDDSTEMSKSQTQAAMRLQVHVFKCVHCPYINTMYQGVLTHSQMKHPTLIPEMDTLLLDVKNLRNWEEYTKKKECGETPKVYGYICEKCQRIFVTLKKLKRHCSAIHQSGESNPVQDEDASLPKPHGNKGSVPMASFLSKKKYGKMRCQHCSYICSSKMALSQHLHIHHKSFAPKGTFKCSLCSHVYYHKKKLKSHYIKDHDKSAYLKYYLPLCKKYNKESDETPQDSSAQQPKTDSTEGRKVFLKCPVCPYFNTRHHGTLTHCQMKHPDVFVRANELETQEMLLSELSGCLIGKNSSEGGYMCDECGGILKSFKKFKTHCQRHHKGEKVSRPPQDVEVERTPAKLPPVLAKKSPSPAKVTEAASSLTDLEASPSKASPKEVQRAYKCQLCSHETTCRKYLRSHYQNTHKLDGITTYKFLEKYNRRKRSYLRMCGAGEKPKYVRDEESFTVKCQQCPDLVLDSHQLLIEHYSHFHGLGSKLDFKVLSFGVRKGSTGIYKCYHCLTKLYGTRKLHYHLDRHRAKMVDLTKALLKKEPAVDPVASGTQQDKLSPFGNVTELGQLKISFVEAVAPSSPVSGANIKVDAEAEKDGHACKQCGRTFMSLSGLHSHEQSHAALAAIEKLDHLSTSGEKLKMNKYVIHKSGTVKPFLCSCCSYRTTLLGLLRRHFLKNHQGQNRSSVVE
uniref:C2H2-type domain-containing protein n=1 Tax=Oryzias latipes TaxID=8090 RepID=A0A3P9JKA0_ORYLA